MQLLISNFFFLLKSVFYSLCVILKNDLFLDIQMITPSLIAIKRIYILN